MEGFKADADNLNATKAILRGLEKRYRETGVKPILIHTVSFLSDPFVICSLLTPSSLVQVSHGF